MLLFVIMMLMVAESPAAILTLSSNVDSVMPFTVTAVDASDESIAIGDIKDIAMIANSMMLLFFM